ncbi:MAG: phenylalanine--tRNA ligase subunit beta [Candidatus Pacebacteria bacterium]|nr:phenylalanine--tRNA ligase subunit beta [Candidatus Paceibacterota bacterium]
MRFSYNWLKEYISGKLPDAKKLGDILMFHSFEVEGVEKIGKDWILDIDVLPNRAHDCLSHIGIAREAVAILGLRLKMPLATPKEDKNLKIRDLVRAEVEETEDCPRYGAIYLKDVQIKDSPGWLKERLKALGLQPINNIVDATNYIMLETGQPLHAFDADKIGKQIFVRRAGKGEDIKTLDKEKKAFALDENMLVIADLRKPVAIAGIKGGEETGIDKNTKNIVVEAANFNPILIRKTSQKLKLKTDASWRFENGIDPNLISFSLDRVAYFLQKVAGGKLACGKVDIYPKKILPKKIKLETDYVGRLLGFEISKAQCIKILTSLGFICNDAGPKHILVECPTRRIDVVASEDLVEEIGRVIGYKNIQSAFPKVAITPPKINEEFFWQNNAKKIMKELGFCEAYNQSFIGEKEKEDFQWPLKNLLEIENPISSLNKFLRPSLCFGLLGNVKENLKNYNEVKLFEIGSVFQNQKVKEKKMAAGILAKKGKKNEGFFELKGVVEELLNDLGIMDIWFDDAKAIPNNSITNLWQEQHIAEIKTNGKEIGFLGEVSFNLLDVLSIKERVFMFELDFEKIIKLANQDSEYKSIVFHPPVFRDLAIIAPSGTKTADILNVIESVGGKIVKDVDLFDVYSGVEVGEGKENLAFHIIYQDENKTLTSREVDQAHKKIIEELEKNPEWEIRK